MWSIGQTVILPHVTVVFSLIQGTTNVLSIRLSNLDRQKKMLLLLLLLFVCIDLHIMCLYIVLDHLLVKIFPLIFKSTDETVSTMAFAKDRKSLL